MKTSSNQTHTHKALWLVTRTLCPDFRAACRSQLNSGQQEARLEQNEVIDPMSHLKSRICRYRRCPVFPLILIATLRNRKDRCYLYSEEIGLDVFWGLFQL